MVKCEVKWAKASKRRETSKWNLKDCVGEFSEFALEPQAATWMMTPTKAQDLARTRLRPRTWEKTHMNMAMCSRESWRLRDVDNISSFAWILHFCCLCTGAARLLHHHSHDRCRCKGQLCTSRTIQLLQAASCLCFADTC